MNGSIELESVEGEGSCFSVNLHLAKPKKSRKPDSTLLTGVHIALLDSYHYSHLSLLHDLNSLGAEVLEQKPGEALPGAPDVIDLILLGVTNAELQDDGLENRIQQLKSAYGSPLLVVVSSSEHAIMQQIRDFGADRCISKPCSRVVLRRALIELLAGDTESETGHLNPRPPNLPELSFLVADDNAVNLRLTTSILGESGASVTGVRNGQEAIDHVAARHFDLIILDLHMPELDGPETARAIRRMQSENKERTPILVLTADVVPAHREMAFDAGIDEYLTKPIDESQMWHTIERMLGYRSDEPAIPAHSFEWTVKPKTYATRDELDALRIAGGRRELVDELFSRFLTELPNHLQTIERHAATRDWPAVAAAAHRLHGATAICGVPALNHAVAALERAAHDAQDLAMPMLLQKLRDAISELLEQDR